MIHPVQFYAATCDNCGKDWRDDHNGWSAMHDENSLWEMLDNGGWRRGDTENNEGKDGEHYCPDCYHVDDEDVFHLHSIQPTFQVIAEFPNNNDFPLGKIITFEKWNGHYWQHKVSDCQGERTWLSEYFEKYPYLFKRNGRRP